MFSSILASICYHPIIYCLVFTTCHTALILHGFTNTADHPSVSNVLLRWLRIVWRFDNNLTISHNFLRNIGWAHWFWKLCYFFTLIWGIISDFTDLFCLLSIPLSCTLLRNYFLSLINQWFLSYMLLFSFWGSDHKLEYDNLIVKG